MQEIDPEIVELLKEAKSRLEAANDFYRSNSLGMSKNLELIEKLKAVIPAPKPIDPRNYQQDFVL